MKENIIDSIDTVNSVDHIDKNNDLLRKAIKTMPISTYARLNLDNKITKTIQDFDNNIQEKVSKKIENNKLTPEQEEKLDKVVFDLANKSNDLVVNMINSLDESFPNVEFLDIKDNWLKELSNVLEWIKFYDKKKVQKLSESEQLLDKYDTWWFSNAYKKHWWVLWMVTSIF